VGQVSDAAFEKENTNERGGREDVQKTASSSPPKNKTLLKDKRLTQDYDYKEREKAKAPHHHPKE